MHMPLLFKLQDLSQNFRARQDKSYTFPNNDGSITQLELSERANRLLMYIHYDLLYKSYSVAHSELSTELILEETGYQKAELRAILKHLKEANLLDELSCWGAFKTTKKFDNEILNGNLWTEFDWNEHQK